MKKFFLAALAAIFCAAPANAQTIPKTTVVYIHVHNQSTTCAWVTIYWGRIHTPWIIEHESDGRPQFVHNTEAAGRTFVVRFTNPIGIPAPGEIKVRAEFTRNADCSGGTVAEYEAYNKGVPVDKNIVGKIDIQSTLTGPPYRVSTPM